MNDSPHSLAALTQRMDSMYSALCNDPRVLIHEDIRHPPLTEQEISQIHQKLGWELDPRFLNFFRVHNGIKLFWSDARVHSEQPKLHERMHDIQEQGGATGGIYIKSLQEIVFDWSDFESSSYEPGECCEDILGQWDTALLRQRLKVLDDFENDVDFGSYHLMGAVIDPIYPDPPVLFSQDYMADFSSTLPMLARDYLTMIIATLGHHALRTQRFKEMRRSEEPIFIPQHTWLDDLPSPKALLDDYINTGTSAHAKRVLEHAENHAHSNPYAHHIDNSEDHPSKQITDTLDPVEVLSRADLCWQSMETSHPWAQEVRRQYDLIPEDLPMVVPLLDPVHYRAENVLRGYFPRATLMTLRGSPIKFQQTGHSGAQVACLLNVEGDQLWYYSTYFRQNNQGERVALSHGINRVFLSRLEWLSLAIATRFEP